MVDGPTQDELDTLNRLATIAQEARDVDALSAQRVQDATNALIDAQSHATATAGAVTDSDAEFRSCLAALSAKYPAP